LFTRLTGWLPPEGLKIVLVLFLSFFIGLEREERRAEGKGVERYAFGGVRTFPLLGLIGYAMTLLSGDQLLPVTAGFAVVAAFLWLSYKHKLETYEYAGATTEISGLATYIVGALVSRGEFWIATTLAILSVLLLELKGALERLSARLPGEEILAFTKFLLLTAVILPIVPNQTFGSFGFNPFKTWLIVVAASGISYGSYLLQKLSQGRGGVLLSSVLGGAYSSTMTTVVLAKRARDARAPHLYAGSMLMASGTMYLRLLVLVGLFNRPLMARLVIAFILLGVIGLVGGWLWSRRPDSGRKEGTTHFQVKNPLELSAAFLFALIFVLLLIATHYAIARLGRGGVYGLAALAGTVDIDPFVLGMTQSAGTGSLALAASGIVIAAASNNMAKGAYAFGFSDRRTGGQAFLLLAGLAILGLIPLAFLGAR
jgi:uncharacterized membrane protein (DUF4010 family)